MVDIPNSFYRTSVKALVLDEPGRFLLQKETGLDVVEIDERPSYFITVLFNNSDKVTSWCANIIYKAKIDNVKNFVPSDECVEIRYFTAKDVFETENVLPNVKEFAKQYIKYETHE